MAAALYRFNAKGYDIQLIGGYLSGDLAMGGGWEGNLGQIGFKGEGTWFLATDLSNDSVNALGASLTFDYMFGSGIYLMGSALYNSRGKAAGQAQGGLAAAQLSARNIFPTEWGFYGSVSGQPHPLVNLSSGLIYGTTNNLVIWVPSVTYSIKENWDIDLVGQVFFSDRAVGLGGAGFGAAGAGVFGRLKWSY